MIELLIDCEENRTLRARISSDAGGARFQLEEEKCDVVRGFLLTKKRLDYRVDCLRRISI